MSTKGQQQGSGQAQLDTDVDRFPQLNDVLRWIKEEYSGEGAQVEKIEVSLNASGEATFRVWRPREIEPEIGIRPAPAS